MKKLIAKLKQFFSKKVTNQNEVLHFYVIEYNNPLTVSQVSNVVNSMISQFPGNCHPQTISASIGSNNVNLRFSSTCMDGQGMANVGNKIMTRYNQDNTVKSVILDNAQIWPL